MHKCSRKIFNAPDNAFRIFSTLRHLSFQIFSAYYGVSGGMGNFDKLFPIVKTVCYVTRTEKCIFGTDDRKRCNHVENMSNAV